MPAPWCTVTSMAIFRTADDTVYALGNHDPFDRTSVLSKGIVGSRDGVPFVASPRHRHAFDLRTGRCLDDEHVSVPSYEVRVVEGVVLVGRPRAASLAEARSPCASQGLAVVVQTTGLAALLDQRRRYNPRGAGSP